MILRFSYVSLYLQSRNRSGYIEKHELRMLFEALSREPARRKARARAKAELAEERTRQKVVRCWSPRLMWGCRSRRCGAPESLVWWLCLTIEHQADFCPKSIVLTGVDTRLWAQQNHVRGGNLFSTDQGSIMSTGVAYHKVFLLFPMQFLDTISQTAADGGCAITLGTHSSGSRGRASDALRTETGLASALFPFEYLLHMAGVENGRST